MEVEDEAVPRRCPVCGREVVGLSASHLNLHSKQELIFTIINLNQLPHNTLGIFQPIKTASSSESRVEEGRSYDRDRTCKKSHVRSTSRRKSSGASAVRDAEDATNQIASLHPFNSATELQPSGSKTEAAQQNHDEAIHQGTPRTLMLEVEPETTEIMPIQICSFISNPGVEDAPNESSDLHTLYPANTMQHADSHSASHPNFIQYIIEGSTTGNDPDQQELDEWILPGGRSIPVYSSFTQIPSDTVEDPLSLDGVNSYSVPNMKINLSTQQDIDLMADEEIPPRGEISEFEESNTSSHQSDELNKPGIMNIGSTLGSLFSDVRRLSPISEQENAKERVLPSRKKSKITPVASTSEIVLKACPNVGTDRHKCPDPNCSQVGSIFELAQHQEKVHQRKYKIIKQKENSSQSSSSRQIFEGPAIVSSTPTRKCGYRCLYCEFYSNKPKLLHGHMEVCHPEKPIKPHEFECRTCGKTFKKRTNLNKHLLIHGVKKFQCHCGKAFTSGFKLMEHRRVHTQDYPFECIHCQKHFRTPSVLKAHLLRIHPQPGDTKPVASKKFEIFCNICSRILRSKRSYAKHLSLHGEKAQKCPICYETFPRNAILTRHIRTSHDSSYETKESKDCPVCLKKMHPNSLKSHLRIHNEEKPFPCSVCNKTFRTAANLTSHSWSHTNADKPFKCPTCPKSYLFKKCLDVHLIIHKRRRFHFVCNECGMKFTSKANLKRHCDEHFSEKKYKCSLCFKRFHRKYYLVEHERIHNGSKPYICTICGKGSTTRSNHRAHIKIHDARESGTQEG